MKDLPSMLAIVGLGLGGVYFLTTESDKKALGAETFMASTGARSVRKDTMYYPLTDDGHVVLGKANPNLSFKEQLERRYSAYQDKDFWEPVVKKIVQKLKRKGQIPNFTAHPGHPSYEEWLSDGGYHFNKNRRYSPIWGQWIHPPIMNQYSPDFLISAYYNRQVMRTPVPKPADWTWWDSIIGNKSDAKSYTHTKWPHFNWPYAAKQREQYRKDLARGVYGPNGSAYLDWGQNVFDTLKWNNPLNLQQWMKLNPTIKAISYKHSKYGWKDFKFWKTLPANWPMMPDGTPFPQMSHRRTQWYLLPDKKDD